MTYDEIAALIRNPGVSDEAILKAVQEDVSVLLKEGPHLEEPNKMENLIDVCCELTEAGTPRRTKPGTGFDLADELAVLRAQQKGDKAEYVLFVTHARRGNFDAMKTIAAGRESEFATALCTAANFQHSRDNDSAIHEAAQYGHVEILEWLITHGADVNDQRNDHRASPLQCAAFMGQVETARTLVAAGANPHVKGYGDMTSVETAKAMQADNKALLVAMRPMGYGCTSWMDPRCDDATAIELVQTAVKGGAATFDTSPMYGNGGNEKTLARGIAGQREKVFISTKIGVQVTEAGMKFIGTPFFLRAEFEKSCENLGCDPDLLILHRVSETTPVEDSMAVFAELKGAGRIKKVGICTQDLGTLERAHATVPIDYLQVEFSPWTREVERNGILEFCVKNGITVMPYTPLGRGFFAGNEHAEMTQNPFVKIEPKFSDENFGDNDIVRGQLQDIATAQGISLVQLTLAWIWGKGEALGVNMLPIPATKSTDHLSENMAARAIILPPEVMAQIDEICAEGAFRGEQHPSRADEDAVIKMLHAGPSATAPKPPAGPTATFAAEAMGDLPTGGATGAAEPEPTEEARL